MATRTIGFTGTPSNIPVSSGLSYLATGIAGGSLVASSGGPGDKIYVYTANYGILAGYVSIYTFNGVSYDILVSQSFSISGAAGYCPIAVTPFNIISGTAYYLEITITTGTGGWGYDTALGNTCERKAVSTPPNPWSIVGGESRTYIPAVYLEYDESIIIGGDTMPDFSSNFQGPFTLLRGRNIALGVSEICLNELGVLTAWATVFNSNYALDVTSSSAADTSAGTGARTIEIYGLDKDFSFQRETVTLNGQTIVTTTKTWRRVFEAVVQTAGSGLKNAGDIYIVKTGTGGTYAAGVPGTLTSGVLKAVAGDNFGLSGIWTVPRGCDYRLVGIALTCRANFGTLSIWHGYPAGNGLAYPSFKIEFSSSSPVVVPIATPILTLKEKEDCYLTVVGSAAATYIGAELSFVQGGIGL